MEWRNQTSRSADAGIRFGPFELDVRTAELRKGGTKIRLPDQPFQILLMLLERPGDLVSREEIRGKLWPGSTVVEFDHSINAAVKRLRDVLRESAEKPRYIETLPRRGYRFIGQCETASIEQAEEPLEQATQPFVQPAVPAEVAGSTVRLLLPVLAVLFSAVLAAAWYYHHTAPARWARNVALPQATRLVDAGNAPAAFPLIFRGLQAIPQDPALNKIRRQISYPILIRTTPPDAGVYIKPYTDPQGAWLYLGQSPLPNFLLPVGYFRWRITKPGFQTVEGSAGHQGPSIDFTLNREETIPAGMVYVPRGDIKLFNLAPAYPEGFWVDKV